MAGSDVDVTMDLLTNVLRAAPDVSRESIAGGGAPDRRARGTQQQAQQNDSPRHMLFGTAPRSGQQQMQQQTQDRDEVTSDMIAQLLMRIPQDASGRNDVAPQQTMQHPAHALPGDASAARPAAVSAAPAPSTIPSASVGAPSRPHSALAHLSQPQSYAHAQPLPQLQMMLATRPQHSPAHDLMPQTADDADETDAVAAATPDTSPAPDAAALAESLARVNCVRRAAAAGDAGESAVDELEANSMRRRLKRKRADFAPGATRALQWPPAQPFSKGLEGDLVDLARPGGDALDKIKLQKLIDATGLLQDSAQHVLEPLTLYSRSELYELFASVAEAWKNSGKAAWKKRINKIKENARYRKARSGLAEREEAEIAELAQRVKEREAWEAIVRGSKPKRMRGAVFQMVPIRSAPAEMAPPPAKAHKPAPATTPSAHVTAPQPPIR